jgi:origin recognition complex subunit 1
MSAGMTRINFQPYTTIQLETIVQTRLSSAKEGLPKSNQYVDRDIITPDGIRFAAMKVSSISGDARRVLDICRHVLKLELQQDLVSFIHYRRTVELVQPHNRTARIEDVKNVIKQLQNSPTAAYLRDCSLHERVMLASLLKCIKREGVAEIKWGEVSRQVNTYSNVSHLNLTSKIRHQHWAYMNILPGTEDPSRKPTPGELSLVLDSLLASRAMLMEDGANSSWKPIDEKRVILNLDQGEVERVLGEEGGQRWKNVLSV